MMASLSHIYIVDPGTAWSVLDFWTDDTVFCNDPSSGCPFQRPPRRMPPFFFVFPAPPTQTSQVRHCIRDAPLPAHNIGRLTYRLGSFYEPNMTFKLTTSCTRNQIQSPFIQIACHKEDNTDRKTASRGQRIFSIICAFKKKKTFPLKEGRMTTWSLKWIKKCVFVFTSVISRVGRKGGEKMSWKRLCDW